MPTPAAAPNNAKKAGAAVPVGLLIFGGLFAYNHFHHDLTTSTTSSAESAASSPGSPTTGTPEVIIGQMARDGKLGFTVHKVDASRVFADPNDPDLRTKAKGEFINVHMTVANIGNEAQTFMSDDQRLVINGKQYDADISASDQNSVAEQINPGLSIDTTVAYDVPVNSAPTSLLVHDSALSGGATILLRGGGAGG